MEKFQLSRSTVRRTLIAMEEKKLLKRVRGGAEIIDDIDENLSIDLRKFLMRKRRKKLKLQKRQQL